ncbi:Rrf2 family transcriptional regulator [Bacillus licheniformis]|nr:Rrf2 family transcriptional regulator [Bacillus licheniformis]
MRKAWGRPDFFESIAQTNDLSEHYLEQLVSPLRNAGLVKAFAGPTAATFLVRSLRRLRRAISFASWKGRSARWKCLK